MLTLIHDQMRTTKINQDFRTHSDNMLKFAKPSDVSQNKRS